jgi:tetratricopeptide (TPR) repeat protein/MinD-like ATPase involved in chromosome partitioning or flagellar assembly
MTVYVTFYSFKGGVGRTLALANAATLLATHDEEPCRILVWDFDLGAPGLQQVFKCRWQAKRQGFVDYVHHYLIHAEMDQVSKYIHPTNVHGVDILPAGAMDHAYAAKLDQIRWRDIYRRARGFDFVEAVKKQIADIQPTYDYVLIDSLTGYSDVGGICVRQLPDTVVLLFRLNQQNMGGISRIYNSIRNTQETRRKPIKVIPVISPSWPFVSPESEDWMLKARKVFRGKQVLEIRFEGSLSFGEKIISKGRKEGEIRPKIVDDYDLLTGQIRELNPEDPITISKTIGKLSNQDSYWEALEASIKLVTRRPNNQSYWYLLSRTVSLAPKLMRDKLRNAANEVITRACETGNVCAYVARVNLLERFEDNWQAVENDLTAAIGLDPQRSDLYLLRGMRYAQHRRYQQAVSDFGKSLELLGSHPYSAFVYARRGVCHLHLGDIERAIQDSSEAVKLDPNENRWFVQRAKVFYVAGRYPEAKRDIDRALELSQSSFDARVLKAPILAAEGHVVQARKQLEEVEAGGLPRFGAVLDLAEAYIAIDPSRTLALLEEYRADSSERRAISLALKVIAAALLHKLVLKEETLKELQKVHSDLTRSEWSFHEIRAFLVWAKEKGLVNEQERDELRKLIEEFEPVVLQEITSATE